MASAWKFYGREEELGVLLERLRSHRWFFGSISGRRRIGKTFLLAQALQLLKQEIPPGRRVLLFQLPDSTSEDAARVFRAAVAFSDLESAITQLGRLSNLPEVAVAIGDLIRDGVIVVIDEFQLCHQGPLRGLPSMLQYQVDCLQDSASGGLIVMGSAQSKMEALLADQRAPLFGRLTFNLNLGPWDLRTVFEVCDQHAEGDLERCLTLWTLFGGVPQYWRLYSEIDELRSTSDRVEWVETLCKTLFLQHESRLRDEGETLLRRELRRGNLAVLRAIANTDACTRAALKEALPSQGNLSGILACLERDLRLVTREIPVFEPEGSTNARFRVSDQFISAWLSAVLPAVQVARLGDMKAAVTRGMLPRLQALERFAFKRMVREAIEEMSRAGVDDFPLTKQVGSHWSRPRAGSSPLEVNVVAWNDERKRVRFGSCRCQALKHASGSLYAFQWNVKYFLETWEGRRFRDWNHEYAVYAPRFPGEMRERLNADGWVCQDLGDFRRMLHRSERGRNGEAEGSPSNRSV